jgi:Tfp pilus assembly protein PilN
MGAALYVSHTVLTTTMASANNIIKSNDLKADIYSETKTQVDTLSAKLNETKGLLNQEIRYSQVLVKMGQLMPAGTILGDLTLDKASFNGQAVEIKAYAKSTNEAGLLQINFQSSPLFRQVTLKGTETNQEVDGYPVTISMSITLNRTGL